MSYRVESLLSARLFVVPQYADGRVCFLSNLSGHLSLYAMSFGGSVPEPLLPPHIALQNPELIGGYSFYVFPRIDRVLVMIDRDGDENYQPTLIPLEGDSRSLPSIIFSRTTACISLNAIIKRTLSISWRSGAISPCRKRIAGI